MRRNLCPGSEKDRQFPKDFGTFFHQWGKVLDERFNFRHFSILVFRFKRYLFCMNESCDAFS